MNVCKCFAVWFQRITFCLSSLFFIWARGDTLTTLSSVSSSSSQINLILDETSLDTASFTYSFTLRTNDSDILVLNIGAFSAEDNGGVKLLVATEDLVGINSDQPSSTIEKWKIISWTGPCTGEFVVTSNYTLIHLVIYQLVENTRFNFRGAACTFSPCIPAQSADQSSSSLNICFSAPSSSANQNARAFHSLLPFNDCYYAFGGISSISPFYELPPFFTLLSENDCGNAVQLKDGQFPINRRFMGSVVAAPSDISRLYILGGIGEDLKAVSDGYISYNALSSYTLSWFSMPALQLFGHAACAFSSADIYVYGGSTLDGGISASLIHWRQKWPNWKTVAALYGLLPPPLIGHSLTCSPDSLKIYLYGGFSLTSTSRLSPNPVVYVFDTVLKQWSTLIITEPRFFHSAVLLHAQFSGSNSISQEPVVLAALGGKSSSSNDITMIDTRCPAFVTANVSVPLQLANISGAAAFVILQPSEPYFTLFSSGGINETSVISASPNNLVIGLPEISPQCLQTNNPGTSYWRCGLAINPSVYFNTNTSRYYYETFVPNLKNDATTFVDIDMLANILSTLASPSVEWVVQCHGWLRLESTSGLNLAAGSPSDDATVNKRSLNFRFAIYLFVDGTLMQSYEPSASIVAPSLPLIDPEDNSNVESNGNGIFHISIFLHGFGPIIPSGVELQLLSSLTGATYVLPTSMLAPTAAQRACSSPSLQASCVLCLLNPACAWQSGSPGSCIASGQEASITTSAFNVDADDGYIHDPGACPSCFLHSSFCRDCTLSSNLCTWIPGIDICLSQIVTIDIPEATITCPTPCFSRKTCSVCTDRNHVNPRCLWCPERAVCVDYFLAEAGVPVALGCTMGCTPDASQSNTICSDDNSWCGTPNEVCVALMAANLLDGGSTTTDNPIYAFPMMRDDDFFDVIPTTSPAITIDPRKLILSKFNIDESGICSGHGRCVTPGRCQCDLFWQGDSCNKECRCYGDARCPDPVRPDICSCPPGATGSQCERCISGYTGNPKNGIPCRSCLQACSNFADTCVSLTAAKQLNLTTPPLNIALLKKLPIAEQNDDIFCVGCRDNTTGNLCQGCNSGYFRPYLLNSRVDPTFKCLPCNCNGHGSYCSEAGGNDCKCEDNTRTAPGTMGSPGCGACMPPFVGEPKNGRSCYLFVSQNQQLCLVQDSVSGGLAAKMAAPNSSSTQNFCRSLRDSTLPLTYSMHMASQVPLASELRIFVGIVSGMVDVVLTMNPESLRPAPKRRSSLIGGSGRQKRAVTMSKPISPSDYPGIIEITPIQNVKHDKNGDSIVYINRAQLQGDNSPPMAVRGVTGRLLIVIAPPNDRLRQGTDFDDTDSLSVLTHPSYVHMRITAVSQASVLATNINDDNYYSLGLYSDASSAPPVNGIAVFRQDQTQIDVFVFFSVFLALFVLLLLGLLLVIRFHAVLTERRRIRARQRRKRAMSRRPFGVSWPRFDLTVLLNPINKLPMKISDLFLPPEQCSAEVIPAPNQPLQLQPPRKTATVVSLQPTSDLRAALATVLIKLPVSKPILRQTSSTGSTGVNEQTSLVTSVPPPPMAFGTVIMRVIVTEQKKPQLSRKGRKVWPLKPGNRPIFDRDITFETSYIEVAYAPVITPSPTAMITNNSTESTTTVPPLRLDVPSAVSRNITASSITLPPTPDTLISNRDDGDDLDDLVDEITAGSISDVSSAVVTKGATRARRPNAAHRGRGASAQPSRNRSMSVNSRKNIAIAAPAIVLNDMPSTSTTGRSGMSSILIPELPDTDAINSRDRRNSLNGVTAKRPPLPPTALQQLRPVFGRRRQSVPAHNHRQRNNNVQVPNIVQNEEDSFA